MDRDGRTWAIDHGLSFHAEPKLRTVLWGWAAQPLDGGDVAALTRLATALAGEGCLAARLRNLLSSDEIAALCSRVDSLLDGGRFPVPAPGYPLPWPLF